MKPHGEHSPAMAAQLPPRQARNPQDGSTMPDGAYRCMVWLIAALLASACDRVGRKPFRADCRTEHAPRPDRDASPMCRIPGGTFQMGMEPTFGPVHPVTLSPFYIDMYEVTNEQFVRYVNEVGTHRHCPQGYRTDECIAFDPAGKEGTEDIELRDGRLVVVPGRERHPVGAVSWSGARKYCQWAGKELPTEAQWEYVARHDPVSGRTRRFPWGDTFEKNRANCVEAECGDGFARNSPVGTFDGTGGRGDGRSPFGVHDLVGNAAEWMLDCATKWGAYESCLAGCTDPVETVCDGRHRVRGWSFYERIPDEAMGARTASVDMPGPGLRCARPGK
jgi:formylglycine-generating enzyme required for sulfatase activity